MEHCNVVVTLAGILQENYLFQGDDHDVVAHVAELKFIERCREYMSNADEYTPEDWENTIEEGYMSFGRGYVFLSWPDVRNV